MAFPEVPPRPILFEPQLAPQLGFVGVGYLLFPLTLITPVPARDRIGLIRPGRGLLAVGQIVPSKPSFILLGPYFPTYRWVISRS